MTLNRLALAGLFSIGFAGAAFGQAATPGTPQTTAANPLIVNESKLDALIVGGVLATGDSALDGLIANGKLPVAVTFPATQAVTGTLSTPTGGWTGASGSTSATANNSTPVFAAGTVTKACYVQNVGTSPIVVDFGGGTSASPVAPVLIPLNGLQPCTGIVPTTAVNVWSPTGQSIAYYAGRV